MRGLSSHPHWPLVTDICQTLQDHGFRALLAGGCVRDGLMNRVPKDFDIATNARPEQVEGLFERTEPVGKQFGIIMVVQESVAFEVATFRKDGAYVDGRRPESIEYCEEQEDALRRDFTVNALFLDPQTQQVIDYVGGQKDLQGRLLRAVGDPLLRFREDRLRMLRAVRFAAQLGFDIESETKTAIRQEAREVKSVSVERIQAEMDKLLSGEQVVLGLRAMKEVGLWSQFFGSTGWPDGPAPYWSLRQWWLWLVILHQGEDFFKSWRHSKLSERWLKAQSRVLNDLKKQLDPLILCELDEETYEMFKSDWMAQQLPDLLIDQENYLWARKCRQDPLLIGADIAQYTSGAEISRLEREALRAQIEKRIASPSDAQAWLKKQI